MHELPKSTYEESLDNSICQMIHMFANSLCSCVLVPECSTLPKKQTLWASERENSVQ